MPRTPMPPIPPIPPPLFQGSNPAKSSRSCSPTPNPNPDPKSIMSPGYGKTPHPNPNLLTLTLTLKSTSITIYFCTSSAQMHYWLCSSLLALQLPSSIHCPQQLPCSFTPVPQRLRQASYLPPPVLPNNLFSDFQCILLHQLRQFT